MKDKLKLILMSLLVILSVLVVYKYNELNKSDEIKFKEEYEKLNGKKVGENKYLSVEITKNNPMYYATYEEVIDVLDGTGVIYLGYPECPWCRNLVSELITASKKVSLDKIYYINVKNDKNELKLNDNGEIETVKKGSKGYNNLTDKLKDVLPIYEGLNDDSIKHIYVPYVIFVKNGEIIYTHLGTVDTQKNPFIGLNDDEKSALREIFVDNMLKVLDTSCDSNC